MISIRIDFDLTRGYQKKLHFGSSYLKKENQTFLIFKKIQN